MIITSHGSLNLVGQFFEINIKRRKKAGQLNSGKWVYLIWAFLFYFCSTWITTIGFVGLIDVFSTVTMAASLVEIFTSLTLSLVVKKSVEFLFQM